MDIKKEVWKNFKKGNLYELTKSISVLPENYREIKRQHEENNVKRKIFYELKKGTMLLSLEIGKNTDGKHLIFLWGSKRVIAHFLDFKNCKRVV